MYTIKYTGEFKRQMKLCQRRGYDMELLREIIRILSKAGSLPPSTILIYSLEIERGNGSAIFSLIGYLFGNSMMTN